MHSQVWDGNSATEEQQCYWSLRVPAEGRIYLSLTHTWFYTCIHFASPNMIPFFLCDNGKRPTCFVRDCIGTDER